MVARAPKVVAGELDVLPAEWGEVCEEVVGDAFALIP